MDLQVGVKALIKNKDGKFLLIRSSPLKYPEKDQYWDIVGGRINAGETLFDNLKREIKEEVGLNLEQPPNLIGAQDILRIPGRHVVRLTYLAEINEGKVTLDEESTEYKWLTVQEIKSIDHLDIYFKELLDKIK